MFKRMIAGILRSSGGTKEPLSPEVERIFEKMSAYLKSESIQNSRLPTQILEQLKKNPACDKIPGGRGEFGRSFSNPVPANGPIGQAIYLSSLRCNGQSVLFHRLGSLKEVDVFEIVSLDGRYWDLLYLSFYFPIRSRKSPSGYNLDESAPLAGRFFGTTIRVEPFPQALYGAVRTFTLKTIGMPLPNRIIREALESTLFSPPDVHQQKIAHVLQSGLHLSRTEPEG